MAESPMQELITDQLRDLYDAEKQLTKALPKLAKATSDEELKQAFRDHLAQTQGHVQRIEQIFQELNLKAKSKPCEAMKGLVREGQEAIEEDLEAPASDMALIAAARRVEHYEMAAYSTLILASQAMKLTAVTNLLQETMKEEQETDKSLTAVAKRLLKDAGKPAPQPTNAKQSASASKKPAPSAKEKASPAKENAPSAKKTAKTVAKSDSPGKGKSSKSPAKGRSKSGGAASNGDHTSHTTTDHDEIRQWAEERGGRPACVRGTGKKGDIGLMRIEFPNAPNANDDKLQEISWEEFFEKFDERGLAMLYQEETADGQKSNFNKLITAA